MRLSTALCGLLPFTLFHATLAFTIQPICTSSFPSNTRIFVATTETRDFMVGMDETPRGELRDDQVETLRNLMTEFATTATEESAQMAEKVLLRMVDEWRANPESAAVPTTDDFYTAITAWSESESPETARHVGFLVLEEADLFEKGLATVKPDERIFRTVLHSLSSSRERGADRRAWAIWERAGMYEIEADADMYGSVIRSLARSKQTNAAERAERVLKEAVTKFPPGMNHDGSATGITVDTFNVVLTAWAKSNTEDGPRRAEDLLVYMDKVHKENGEDKNLLTPNVSSFTSLIDAYAQTNEWDGVSQSERILNRLLDQYLEGDDSLEPNVASWTIVISAWTRLARKNFNRCAEKADKLLRRMEELYQEGRTTVAADAITYITVMNAWAVSKSPDGPQRAEEILAEMNERYLDGEDEMRPTPRSIKTVIDSWIKMDDSNAMDRAEAVLDKYEGLEEFEETVQDETEQEIYRSMLFGYSKNKDPYRAEGCLRDMVSMGMKPDCFCFDRIIEAYTQLKAPDSLKRTYAVFELMEECRKVGNVKPNERVYTSFIRALTRARVRGLAKSASLILKKMERLYEEGNKGIKPTIFTYNAVLNACAESISTEDAEPLEAFTVAIGIFNDLRNGSEGPDHVTFGNMLRCAALLPEGERRDAVVSSIFSLCCRRGFVNSYVVRDLQYASCEELWRSLLRWPVGEVDCVQLPATWRNQFERKAKPDRPASARGRPAGRKFSKRY